MNPFEATAMAIFMFEGGRLGKPTTRNIRNNNPGNLRPYVENQPVDADKYRTFNSFAEGWFALIFDIEYKVHRHLSATSTMVDFFKLYAPAADNNDPKGYAQYVVGWLATALGKTITLDTKIYGIYPS